MRLPEDAIKQGILHPEQLVRDAAVQYFADSFSDDPTVMPLAIQAIADYGWEDGFESFTHFAELAQTEDTLLWSIDEFDKVPRATNQKQANRRRHLSCLLSQADVALLMPHQARIMALAGLSARHRKAITERLRLLAADTQTCWRELEQFCEKSKDKHYINDVDLGHANRIVEAIGRHDTYGARVLTILSQQVENHQNSQMAWMQALAARLAGEMRLEPAAPLLVARLHEDAGDLLNEECMRAFVKIGTDGTVQTLCEGFAAAPWHYKLYTSSALGKIHSDVVVSKCLALYEPEKDFDIKLNLIRAVLNSFSCEGIEPARDLTRRDIFEVRRQLVAVATLSRTTFPELGRWMKEEQQQATIRKRAYEEMLGGFARPKPKTPSFKNPLDPQPQATITRREEIGRNDPCPCGSGKKYKKCCDR